MKKLNNKQKKWHKKYLARLASNKSKQLKNKNHHKISNNLGWKTINLPKTITLDNASQREQLIQVIDKIKELVDNKKKVIFNFSNVEKIYAPAMLLLYANLKNLKDKTINLKIKLCEGHNPKIKQILHQIEFDRIFNKKIQCRVNHKDVIHWRKSSGKNIDNSRSQLLFTDEIKLIDLNDLYSAFGEAMSNSVEHAYSDEDMKKLEETWWMFSQYKDKSLSIALCDLGMGIPKSLELKDIGLFNRMKVRAGLDKVDKFLIEEAIKESKSRHGDRKERGKGLSQIVASVQSYGENAGLMIYSNFGRYQNLKETKKLPSTCNYKTSIYGTIIFWKIPI